MIFTGVLVEATVILIFTVVGRLFGKLMNDRMREAGMAIIGVAVIFLGVSGAMETKSIIVLLSSLLLGTMIGEALDLEGGLNRVSLKLSSRFAKGEGASQIAEAYVTSSLIICVGAMSVIGPLRSGLLLDHSVLYAKAIIVALTVIILASTLGPGVALSAITVIVYEGLIVLLAHYLKPFLTDQVVAEISAAGSVILMGLGLNLAKATDIRVTNQIPSIVLPVLIVPLANWLSKVLPF